MTWAFGCSNLPGGRRPRAWLMVVLGSLTVGCAARLPAPVRVDPAPSTTTAPAPEPPTRVASVVDHDAVPSGEPPLPAIREANRQALRAAQGQRFSHARLHYPYVPDRLYRVDTAVSFPTTLIFAPGEWVLEYVGLNDDWIVKVVDVGEADTRASHVVLAAKHPKLHQGLTVITTRGAYFLDVRSHAHTGRQLTAVSWVHPPPPVLHPKPRGPRRYHVGYDIQAQQARMPLFEPVAVWDNGRQTMIELPEHVQSGRLPQVYEIGPDGKISLVNWRIQGPRLIVDHVVPTLELRLGAEAVRILRSHEYRAVHCPGADICGMVEG